VALKNIIICTDGTGNTAVAGGATHVFRLYEAVDENGHRIDPRKTPQVAVYHDGVATESLKWPRLFPDAASGPAGVRRSRRARVPHRPCTRKVPAEADAEGSASGGSANPRHPVSSPAWTGVEKTIAHGMTYQGDAPTAGHEPVAARYVRATATLVTGMSPIAKTYHTMADGAVTPARSSASTPARPVVDAVIPIATSDGANVPSSSNVSAATGASAAGDFESSIAAPKQLHVTAYVSTKNSASGGTAAISR
jgi:type VI secretion system (T6SS) phospholipase Tle1-like effector